MNRKEKWRHFTAQCPWLGEPPFRLQRIAQGTVALRLLHNHGLGLLAVLGHARAVALLAVVVLGQVAEDVAKEAMYARGIDAGVRAPARIVDSDLTIFI